MENHRDRDINRHFSIISILEEEIPLSLRKKKTVTSKKNGLILHEVIYNPFLWIYRFYY